MQDGLKKCPYCAEEIQYEAVKCKHCGEMLTEAAALSSVSVAQRTDTSQTTSTVSAKPNYTARNVTAAVILLLIVGGLGMFHVVWTGGGFTFVPKAHFTLSMTFISVEEVVDRWNNRTLGEAMHGDALLEHLRFDLEQRGYIGSRKKTWEELGDDVRHNLPDK